MFDRIAGDTVIVPDDRMRAELAARRTPTDGEFFVCRGPLGTVQQIDMTQSTGSVAYDRLLERRMSAWRYQPFKGVSPMVCGAVQARYAPSAP